MPPVDFLQFEADRIRFVRTLDNLRQSVQTVGSREYEAQKRTADVLIVLASALGLEVTEGDVYPPWGVVWPLRDPLTEASLLSWLRTIGAIREAVVTLPAPPGPEEKWSLRPPSEVQTTPTTAGRTDGVEGGRWLWWQGKRHDIPKGNVYRLIGFMWSRDSASYEELNGAVFDDPVEPQTVRSLTNKANSAMKKIGIPWKLSTDSTSRHVTKGARQD